MKPASSSFIITRWIVSLAAAFAAIFLRTSALFNPRTTLDEISLAAALALGVGLLCYLIFPFFWDGFSFARTRPWTFLLAWILGGLNAYFLVAFFRHFHPAPFQTILLSALFVTLGGLAFNELILAMRVRRTISNEIAPGGGQSRLIGFVSRVGCDALAMASFLLAAGLAFASIRLCFQFPEIFDRSLYLLDASAFLLFLVTAIFSAALLGWTLARWEQSGRAASFRAGAVYAFVRDHAAGIFLALLFFMAYFCLGTVVNFPGYQTVDLFYDSDSTLWLIRMARDPGETNPVRGAHPYILLILRPLTWAVSLLFNGNRTFAAFAVNAAAGALCVFFTWRFFQRLTGNSAYALTLAALLGASVSHLLFGSFLETYIFSALALIVFLNLLLQENPSLPALTVTGLVVFGITITNLAQTVVAFFLAHPRHCEKAVGRRSNPYVDEEIASGEYALAMTAGKGILNQIRDSLKLVLKYAVIVVLLAVGLSLVQAWMFEGTRVFFIPSNLLSEQKFSVDVAGENSWKLTGRVLLLARSLFLYNIIASKPLILSQELGTPLPNFRTFYASKGEYIFSSYAGLSDVLVKIWVLLVIVAALTFLWNLIKSPKSSTVCFSIAMLLCLGFNAALHLTYGDDPLLYSADWTYALVFFVGLSLHRWADKKWLVGLLLVFIALLMVNNLGLFADILSMSAPLFPLK